MKQPFARRRPAPRIQRGVSLIIAMLMLVVIGLVSAAVMRNTTSSDRVINNNRLQTQANQFAQLALQFCEGQVQLSATGTTPLITIVTPAPTPADWTVPAKWGAGGVAHTVTGTDVTSAVAPVHPPQCMAEQAAGMPPGVWTVTARGFSDDWSEDSTTKATLSGSVVWLQSTVAIGQ